MKFRPNLDRTLTELWGLKKTLLRRNQKIIDFVRNQTKKLLNEFDFGADGTYFTKEDFDIQLCKNGDVGVYIETLRYRHRPGEPESFVESEDLEANPIWVRNLESKLSDELKLKKHGITIFINPSLFPK